MPKEKTMTIRIEEVSKGRISSAAVLVGESLSTFTVKAATERAEKVLARPAKNARGQFPVFFRALAFEAASGGALGWRGAASHLAKAVPGELDNPDEELPPLQEALQALMEIRRRRELELITAAEAAPALEWFDEYFPRCMDLVPKRRRLAFAQGVLDVYEQNGIDQ